MLLKCSSVLLVTWTTWQMKQGSRDVYMPSPKEVVCSAGDGADTEANKWRMLER
jgi:hypothetical protein